MKKGILFLTLIIGLILLISLTTVVAQQTSTVSVTPEVDAVTAAINSWRLELGLWPVQPDAVLTRMAFDQARYLMSIPQLPAGGDIHIDQNGLNPRQRAPAAPYNWVTYGPEVTVNEIAYVGANVRRAIEYWQGSSVHTRTVSNGAYRQIGVAALPHQFGFLYIVVLGGQPNVLPAIPDIANGRLYLSNDSVSAPLPARLSSATQIQLFDALGRPLSQTWLPWQPYLTLPQGVGDRITVMYSDGTRFSVTTVNLNAQTSLFNNQLQLLVDGVPATPMPVQNIPAEVAAPATVTPRFEVPPTIAPTSVTSGITPEPSRPNDNVALYYSSRTLTLHNITDAPVDVSRVTMQGNGITLRTTFWQTEWLSGSLNALVGRDCLQLWAWTEPSELPREAVCRQRRGVITLSTDRMFWRTTDISVYQGDSLLATCARADNQCTFNVPQ